MNKRAAKRLTQKITDHAYNFNSHPRRQSDNCQCQCASEHTKEVENVIIPKKRFCMKYDFCFRQAKSFEDVLALTPTNLVEDAEHHPQYRQCIQTTCHNREVLTLRGGDFFVSAHEPRIGERWRLGAHARGEKSCEMT